MLTKLLPFNLPTPKPTSGKGILCLILNSLFSSLIYLNRVACFELEEYETALAAFEKAASLDKSDPSFKTWIRKCQAEISSMHSTNK